MYCIIKLSTSTTVQSRDLLIRVGILRCIEILNHFFANGSTSLAKRPITPITSLAATRLPRLSQNKIATGLNLVENLLSTIFRCCLGGTQKKIPVLRAMSLTDYLPIISSDAQPSIYREILGTWARERISLNPRAFARMSALSRLAKVFSIRV